MVNDVDISVTYTVEGEICIHRMVNGITKMIVIDSGDVSYLWISKEGKYGSCHSEGGVSFEEIVSIFNHPTTLKPLNGK